MLNKFKSIIAKPKDKGNFFVSVKSLEELKYFNSAKQIFSTLENEDKNTKLMFVGGCVRKLLSREQIKDIDIATNLSPEKIKKILNQNNIKFFETGISHGTITVINNGYKFEITTLRKDVATDGRHADVEFISDWEVDAQRRDFTIKAVYSNLRGEIFDPLEGAKDLKKGIVKFIGDSDKRIKEDYLRILRYLRFYTQYSKKEHDAETIKAIKRNLNGVIKISKERILDELFKILELSNLNDLFDNEFTRSIISSIFPQLKNYGRINILNKISNQVLAKLDAVLVLSILLIDSSDNCEYFLYKFNLSNKNKKRILFLQNNFRRIFFKSKLNENELLKLTYSNGKKAVIDLLVFSIFVNHDIDFNLIEKQISFIENSQIPIFPIEADFLKLQYGFSESRELGMALKKLEEFWINNSFQIDKKKVQNILKLK